MIWKKTGNVQFLLGAVLSCALETKQAIAKGEGHAQNKMRWAMPYKGKQTKQAIAKGKGNAQIREKGKAQKGNKQQQFKVPIQWIKNEQKMRKRGGTH